VGLRGNVEDYENINNSLLPEVIDTRLGIPITLSLVYILVGRRAGIPISGAGLPGHFLIRHGQNFFDPFHGGVRVGLDECRARVAQHGLALTASTLQPFPAPQFLARILNNLLALAEESDPPLAAKIARWIDGIAQ
jgi:regulator of sirC expression with transglutaminase-like and TPR domain